MKKRKDGRYRKSIKDSRTGKIIDFYGNTEKEVFRKIMEYSDKKEKGRTFKEVADSWWADTYERISPQTVRSYKVAMQRAVEEFGSDRIKEITTREITAFLRIFAGKGYAQKTVLNQKLILNLIFVRAVEDGDILSNPCLSATIPRGLSKKPRKAASDSDEEVVKKSAHIWLFPFMAIMTGMRKGELIALQWKDVDFERNTISVTKSSYFVGATAQIKSTKTEAGVRSVPLLKPLRDELLKQKDKSPDKYILSGEKPLSSTQFRHRLNRFKKETGVECTAHQLRHSFATIAFECGVPIKSVQEILGHANYATTMDIYTDFRKQALDEASDKLNSAMKV